MKSKNLFRIKDNEKKKTQHPSLIELALEKRRKFLQKKEELKKRYTKKELLEKKNIFLRLKKKIELKKKVQLKKKTEHLKKIGKNYRKILLKDFYKKKLIGKNHGKKLLKDFYKKTLKETGIVTFKYCHNNTFITLSDVGGKTIARVSAGLLGYRNSRKKTWLTFLESLQAIAKKVHEKQKKNLYVNFRGYTRRKNPSMLRILRTNKLFRRVTKVVCRVSLPHNGCRKIQKRRK